ncbi:MAG: acyl-CoA thioesterase [Thaumarchaeota archaeon]|nr:acyl-CoA thioesterase [Candidatus Calditenuaceae archaeon]MDW8187140.1 hotdog domain-containing protein [Nitrososphaerota archaeon]
MTPSETYTQTMRVVMPRHANPVGFLFGGNMLSWIVESSTSTAIGTVAGRGEVVLGFMGDMHFINPITVGSVLVLRSWVGHVGRSSLTALTEVLLRRPAGTYIAASFARAIYVCIGPDLRPQPLDAAIGWRDEWEKEVAERTADWRRSVERVLESGPIPPKGRVRQEMVSYRRIAPEDTFSSELMFAGRLLQFMDEIAGILAYGYAEGLVVTASVDQISFNSPVRVGDTLKLVARLTRVWRSSMEVECDALVVKGEEERPVSTSYFTFVGVDVSGRPREVPPYVPVSPEELEVWEEAGARRERRRASLSRLEAIRHREFRLEPGSAQPVLINLF